MTPRRSTLKVLREKQYGMCSDYKTMLCEAIGTPIDMAINREGASGSFPLYPATQQHFTAVIH